MRSLVTLAFLPLATLLALAPAPARATMQVVFGPSSWDGPGASLQEIVDARYGPGAINVQTDYLGFLPTQPDPFFWIDERFSAMIVREIAGYSRLNVLGWYQEPEYGHMPVIDGVDDGIVFEGSAGDGATAMVVFNRSQYRFGFYLDPAGPGSAINAPQPELFYTNRWLNDVGPDGTAPMHTPIDGDAQALVYDVSRWTQPNTWLVAFEDLDSGAMPGPCCGSTDNDFNDFVFEVTAISATPALPISFGALKARYR